MLQPASASPSASQLPPEHSMEPVADASTFTVSIALSAAMQSFMLPP
jgi:hypothetical protein